MRLILSTIAVISILLIVAYSFHVLLIGFAGLLVAIFLRTAADWLSSRSDIAPNRSLAIVIVLLLGILFGNIWLFGISFANQVDEMWQGILQARDQLYQYAQQYSWGQKMWPRATQEGEGAMLSGARSALAGGFDVLVGLILMLFISIYISSNPGLYRRGFLWLIPEAHRARTERALEACTYSLRWWILGQVVSMIIVGVVTTIGLLLLGIPLPFALGFITALLNFIPNVGAVLSGLLAMSLAFTKGMESVVYVAVLYLLIQSLEGYVLTPMIQQRAVSLPPALTITVQAIMSVLVGGVGLALAAPITVVGIVLTRQLYLNETTQVGGRSGGPRSSLREAGARLPKAST